MKRSTLKLSPAAFAALLLAGQAHAVGTGTIADGTGNISKNGSTTNVNQTSDKLIVNWDNMDVAKSETLNFNQKNANAAVLNRVNSADPTSILGTLNANGRVFIVNPNGVMIGSGAMVNVGSLVASSLNISDDDFKAGRLNFKGGGKGGVTNEGTIRATESVGLIGPQVTNNGQIVAGNNAVLAAGDEISLNFADSNLQAKISKESLEALVQNKGFIRTENGDIVMTAWARKDIARAVINNSGVLDANTLSGNGGNIKLESLGGGTVSVGGRAKAAGAVSISGARLVQNEDSVITAQDVSFTADDGGVTLSGNTTANGSVSVSGKNVSLDGRISAGGLNINATQLAATTDRASSRARSTSFKGGRFDLTRGNNAFDYTNLNVDSADIAFNGDSTVFGSVNHNLRLRSDGNLGMSALRVGGNLEASAGKDLSFNGLVSGGDIKLSGKSVRALPGSSNLDTSGNVTVTADEDVSLQDVRGKTVDLRAKRGTLEVGRLNAESAYLEGGDFIRLNGRATTERDLTIATQGRGVVQLDGVEVGGDLTYKVGADSIVSSYGTASKVAGKTTGALVQDDEARKAAEGKQRAEEEKRRAEAEKQRAEEEKRRAEEEAKWRAEEEKRQAEAEKQRAEEEKRRAEEEAKWRAEEEKRQAEAEKQRAEEEKRRAEEEAKWRAEEEKRQAEAKKQRAEDEAARKAADDDVAYKAADEARKATEEAARKANEEAWAARRAAEEAWNKASQDGNAVDRNPNDAAAAKKFADSLAAYLKAREAAEAATRAADEAGRAAMRAAQAAQEAQMAAEAAARRRQEGL
jgi:filamentous hemagglutinin family protein